LANNYAFKETLNNRKFTSLEMNVYLAISAYNNVVQSMSGGALGAA
jgi:hypothetical protein